MYVVPAVPQAVAATLSRAAIFLVVDVQPRRGERSSRSHEGTLGGSGSAATPCTTPAGNPR
jgi:hypothetical protein